MIPSTQTNLTLLVGTTKGAFLIYGGNDRSDWAIRGPYCDGWPINHVIGDAETGTLSGPPPHEGTVRRVSITRHKHGIDKIYYRGAKAIALIAFIFKLVGTRETKPR